LSRAVPVNTEGLKGFDFLPVQKYTVVMSASMETILGNLGSRFCLNFRPDKRQLLASPLGTLYDMPLRLEISILADDARFVWPFSPGEPMGSWEQSLTMTGVGFRCESSRLGVELFINFTAPFYPQDEKLSTSPFFYLDLACRPMSRAKKRVPGEIKVGMFAGNDETLERENAYVVLRTDYRLAPGIPPEDADEFSRGVFEGAIALAAVRGKMSLKETAFSVPYSIERGAWTRARFVLAAHCDEPVLDVDGAPHRFRYLRWFPRLVDVIAFARDEETQINERVGFFDDLFLGCSLGHFEKNFIAVSFQSHLAATWWTEPVFGEGPDRFGSWDGEAFHDTMKCEHASSLLYLNLWPDLLEKQLDQRASRDKNSGYLPSSCGRFLSVKSLPARVADVEDTCDYLLMMFAHWRWWNRFETVERNASLIRRLADFVLRSGPEGTGTDKLDKAAQTDRALRTLCGLEAAAAMAGELGDGDLSDSCARRVREIGEALTEELSPGQDRDHHLGGGGALLHLLMSDSFPELDYGNIAGHILSSGKDRPTGRMLQHAGNESYESPVSENLWLDLVAAYLGIDFIRKAQRYWASRIFADAAGDGGDNADSRRCVNLAGDPQGACAIGLLQAAIGLKLDRVEGNIVISPLSIPSKIPLLPLADWEERRAPWANVKCEGGRIAADVEGRDLIEAAGEFAVDPHRELKWGGS